MADATAKMVEEPSRMMELTVPAEEGQLSRVRDFVVEVCEEASFSRRETNSTKLAVDEACTNIIKHAYTEGKGEIKVQAAIGTGKVEFSIFDTGERFDFSSVKDPDLNQYVESGKKGGLGIYLINRLMDSVRYHSTDEGNTLILAKQSRAALARVLPGAISWRNSLRFKFTLRAGLGLFLLVAIIWGFIFSRQTSAIHEQMTMQWMEKKRLAMNLANRSQDVLLEPEAFSVEQTNLTAYLAKLSAIDDLAYIRVLDREGKIVSSGNVDEIFTEFKEPQGEVLLEEESGASWKRFQVGDRTVRDIFLPVSMRSVETGRRITLGGVHVGVYEDIVGSSVEDPRLGTTLLIIGIYLLGILLIMGLVKLFVKPIQILTDGVRAIGQGSLEGKISIDGPAEIGAIAQVFNEITEKFKTAQESILEQEKLQKEMEVAKQIQQSLLPRKMPDVSGYDIAPYYQAAMEVGGDYYDFVEVDDDTIGIVVADVSGKGVPGSLVMTMIRTALRMEARGNKNASDVMAKMNDFVTDDMRKGMFVTMFYVILDSKNRIISYASAGHNPMILFRAERNETYFLNPKGFPVGISLPDEALFRKSISLEKVKLKKDDMLLVYTDGVTEAMNDRRDQYGEERLISLVKTYGRLHPKEFITKLEEDVKSFTGGSPQNDDITVVAIKEKLAADDVLYGLRRRLIDMVEVGGMSVKDACEKMKVSPATYYRYKKRMEAMGERGLRDKVLRQDIDLKRVSLEERREILAIIRRHPGYGAKRIVAAFNEGREESKRLTERMVYEELKRLNLNTKALRLDYLRRNRLIDEETYKELAQKPEREVVEEFLAEISRAETDIGVPKAKTGAPPPEGIAGTPTIEFERAGDIGISMSKVEGDITVLRIDGHLDSVSSSAFEKKLKEIITEGAHSIVVDLSDVTYISSGGWGIFSGEVQRLREQGGDVVLAGMTSEVYDVYDLLGFADVILAFLTVEDAIKNLRLPAEERFQRERKVFEEPVGSGLAGPGTAEGETAEELPGESYVPEWESLRIEATTVGERGDIAVLSLKGIVDTVSAANMRKALDNVISNGLLKIVVDMSLVEYVSSGGWGTFTERLREVRRAGGDIKLFGMDPDVYYVFTMLGFNIVLSSFDILSDAIEDFKREQPGPQLDVQIGGQAGEGVVETGEERVFEEVSEETALDLRTRGPDAVTKIPDRTVEDLVSWESAPDRVLIALLSGSIEASAVAAIGDEIEYFVEDKPRVLVFDLQDVTYISSTGWGLIAKYHERCAEWGGRVVLSSMSGDLYEIYRCLEFHSFIPAFPSKEEALQRIAAGELGPERETEAGPAVGEEPAEHADEESRIPGEEVFSVDDLFDGEDTPRLPSDEAARGKPTEDAPPADKESEGGERPMREGWPEIRRDVESDVGPKARQQIEKWGEAPEEPRSAPEPRGLTREPDEDDQRSDREARPVDIDSAVSDKNLSEDRRLREMGWERYGEALKRRLGRKKKDGNW